MQMTPEVIAALATLKQAAENDFERHRLDVLERDLTAPPQVVQLDESHQEFNGVVYTKRKCGHYEKIFGVHQMVWLYFNGTIPPGYVVHHKDENPANNASDNLLAITRGEHSRLHGGNITYRRKCPVCQKIFLTQSIGDIYCSRECKLQAQSFLKICAYCGKEFSADIKHREKLYCSKECQLLARTQSRNEKLSGQKEQCRFCGKIFSASERVKGGFCSSECANKHHTLANSEVRICLNCGAEFSAYKYGKTKYCSRSCSAKARELAKRQLKRFAK